MFNPFLLSLAAVTLATLPAPASAAPNAHTHLTAAQAKPLVAVGRPAKPRALTSGLKAGKGPCGVWRCTWPISGGGCLVWEKTVCKVINPFD